MSRRREFLFTTVAASVSSAFGEAPLAPPLREHRLDLVEFPVVSLKWPRHVGRNSRKGHHGHGPQKVTVVKLTTNQGAIGWGQIQGTPARAAEVGQGFIGKRISELISPVKGILDEELDLLDVALHDLAGVILGQPVWKMMNPWREKPFLTNLYSGMIYFDDLDPEDSPAGIDKVLENCQWDIDYGYRQLKVKIGRGGRWMEKQAGLKRDIEVVRAIGDAFPDVDILVDGNDAFTLPEIIAFCEGIGDVPLFWIEEPFRETVADWTKLSKWLKANGRERTLCADGEARPDFKVLEDLATAGVLDVRLEDICSHEFTPWRRQMPGLIKAGVQISPHTWGSALKSVYVAHFVGAWGHSPTIEGVTTKGGNVDFGENRIVEGQLVPSSQPGFGLQLPT